jgi:hypothetical protein
LKYYKDKLPKKKIKKEMKIQLIVSIVFFLISGWFKKQYLFNLFDKYLNDNIKKVLCGFISAMPVEVAARSWGCCGIETMRRRGSHSYKIRT